MKKMMFAVSSLVLVLGSSLSWSAGENSDSQPSASQPSPQAQPSGAANPGANPFMGGTQAVQTPPADWTTLTGMVQAVDADAKTVQIKDDSGKLLQVPVDRQVQIEKDGKSVKLSQIQTGDSITLSKRSPSAEEGSKTY